MDSRRFSLSSGVRIDHRGLGPRVQSAKNEVIGRQKDRIEHVLLVFLFDDGEEKCVRSIVVVLYLFMFHMPILFSNHWPFTCYHSRM